MGSFKTNDRFLLTFLIVAATIIIFVGVAPQSPRPQAPRSFLNVCKKAPIKPAGVHLNVPLLSQGAGCGWCWGAGIAMLGTHYNKHHIDVCEVVTHTTTVTVDGKRLDCCAPKACAGLCNHGGSDAQVRNGFLFVGYQHDKIDSAISEAELQTELSSNRPVMITMRATKPTEFPNGKKEYGGHARIVSGFTPPTPPHTEAVYDVLDSNYRTPIRRTYSHLILEPEDIVEKPYRWESTLVLTATAAPECQW